MGKIARLVGGRSRVVFLVSSWILALCPVRAAAAPWTPAGLPGGRVVALAADPVNPGTILAAAARAGIYKTVNGGATWSLAHGTDRPRHPLAAGRPESAEHVLRRGAGQDFQERGRRSELVRDAGRAPRSTCSSWIRGGPTISGGNGGGILRTTDRGATWVARNEGLVDVHVQALAIDFSSRR
jgi:hypothetical protein